MIKQIRNNSYLLKRLIVQDIMSRYKGSVLGILWSVLIPIFMLVIYTFVFSEIFQAKWSVNTTNKFEFALILFCGLAAFNMISEVINRSTNLIASNTNYVKKVIFPLEFLPLSITCTALFNCLISYIILIIANFFLTQNISKTLYEFFIIILPLFILSLGVSYFLAAISVYLRDIVNAVGIILMVLMYVSPVFFSLEAVPEKFVVLCKINPLTFIIENLRNVVLYGKNINISYLIQSTIISFIFLFSGYFVFNRTKEGFADVL